MSEFKNRGRANLDNMDGDAAAPAQSMTDQKDFGLGASESKLQSLRRLSNGESEDSHQPSAEFVERLEKVNRVDANFKDLEKQVFDVDGLMPPSIISLAGSDDPNSIVIQENQFNEGNLKDESFDCPPIELTQKICGWKDGNYS